jgi:hypothetical protein
MDDLLYLIFHAVVSSASMHAFLRRADGSSIQYSELFLLPGVFLRTVLLLKLLILRAEISYRAC